MHRVRSLVLLALSAGLAWPAPVSGQARPRPEWSKGHKLRVKIDSSPQQAAIYVDSRDYGIQGYTPTELKLPKGTYRIILELAGFKPEEQILTISRSQAFAFTLVKQARPAILDVRAATDQSSLGGSITVDGAAVGSVPNQVEVSAGSHLLEVRKAGFNDYRDTISVSESERRTVVVALIGQVRPGAILVTADVAGADVFVDGQQRDAAPTLIGDLPEGDHTVEVRKEGFPPWKQAVRVVAGQQAKVVAQLQAAKPAAGSLKVISATPMANVVLDGDAKGPANAEIKDVRAGVHIVELRADGFEAKRVEVDVKAGELRVIPLDLAREQVVKKLSQLHVISPVPDAEVFLDGSSVGKAPVDRDNVQPGKHFIVVHKDGYADYKVEIDLEPDKTFQVSANLQASGTMRALSNPAGAEVLIDGTVMGKTPATIPNVAVGEHVVEYKMKDFLDAKQTVRIAGGQTQIVQLDLAPISRGPTVGQLEMRQREQSSFGAMTIDRFKFNLDVGFGYPYFFTARVITGVFNLGNLGGDIGVEFRTNGYNNEIGLRPRVQIFRADPFALGAEAKFFAGGGPTKRDSFSFEIGPLLTLLAGSYIHLTLEPYISVNSDRLCPAVSDIQSDDVSAGVMNPPHGSGGIYGYDGKNPTAGNLAGQPNPIYDPSGMKGYHGAEKLICKTYDSQRSGAAYALPGYTQPIGTTTFPAQYGPYPSFLTNGQPDPRDRFTTVRFMIRGVLEAAVGQRLTIFLMIEGAPLQGERQAFTGKFNDILPTNDLTFYFQLGATGKF